MIDVEVIGTCPDRDIALLRVKPEGLAFIKAALGKVPVLPLGDSDLIHRSDEVMILGLNNPTIFDLDIKNNGTKDTFTIYTFFGSGYTPKEAFTINKDETKNSRKKAANPNKILDPFLTFLLSSN